MKKFLCILGAGIASVAIGLSAAHAWSLEEAAKPYKGTEVSVIFLDRSGYRAIIKMLPDFEQKTGIKVKYEIVPYESTLEKEVRDFSSNGDLSIALVDLVLIGTFADSDCIVLLDDAKQQYPAIFYPNYDNDDFCPQNRNAFGGWNGKIYGPPFDNYSGLHFYNNQMLKDAGFDKPPEAWDQLLNEYGAKLTKD